MSAIEVLSEVSEGVRQACRNPPYSQIDLSGLTCDTLAIVVQKKFEDRMTSVSRIVAAVFSAALLCSSVGNAQPLSDEVLRQALHQAAKTGHEPLSYGAARGALEIIHRDPDHLGNILLFYTGRSQDVDKWVSSDSQDGWNREHLWPQSRGMRSHPMKGDLHNLRPTDASVNQRRGNLNFDNGGSAEGEAPDTFLDADSFEPRDDVKGDVARALFYVDVRYDGDDAEPDLELVDASTPTGGHTLGDLCTLLEWHLADPVSAEEHAQNDAVEGFQGNRNPFIDTPEQAVALYGASCGVPGDGNDGDGENTSLTIATWNIANLHHESGVALRDGAAARDDIDYDRLAAFAQSRAWDIVALQEVGSPQAVRRIFPEDQYHLVISDRYIPGAENRPAEERDIYTAMVFAKSAFATIPETHGFAALSIGHVGFDRDGTASTRPTRAAIITEVSINGEMVKIMGVHLKSSCHGWSLDPVTDQSPVDRHPFTSRFDCRTLAAQRAILESWIEQQAAMGTTTLVLGDFNRRLNATDDTSQPNDDFWRDLNDGAPSGLTLEKGPGGIDTVCWPNYSNRFEDHIDFVVYDSGLADLAALGGPQKVSMGFEGDPRYAAQDRQRMSDHCPVEMKMQWE